MKIKGSLATEGGDYWRFLKHAHYYGAVHGHKLAVTGAHDARVCLMFVAQNSAPEVQKTSGGHQRSARPRSHSSSASSFIKLAAVEDLLTSNY